MYNISWYKGHKIQNLHKYRKKYWLILILGVTNDLPVAESFTKLPEGLL